MSNYTTKTSVPVDAVPVTGTIIHDTSIPSGAARAIPITPNYTTTFSSTEISNDKTSLIERAYELYVQKLLSENKIDFDLIIEKVIDLMNKNPAILELYRKTYQYLIIDDC